MRRILTLLSLPLVAAGTYVLRLFQFIGAPDGLSPFFVRLWSVLPWALLAVFAIILPFPLSREPKRGDFRTDLGTAAGLPFQWAGVGLMLFSGAYGAYVTFPAVQTLSFLASAATCAGALLLLPAVTVTFHRRQNLPKVTLLLSALAFAFRLFTVVQALLRGAEGIGVTCTCDPEGRALLRGAEGIFSGDALALFIALLLLSLITLASLAFGDRAERRLLFFTACAFASAGAAFCRVEDFSVAVFLVGGAAFALGCFLSVLFAVPASGRRVTPPSPFTADGSPEGEAFDLARVDRLFREAERHGRS